MRTPANGRILAAIAAAMAMTAPLAPVSAQAPTLPVETPQLAPAPLVTGSVPTAAPENAPLAAAPAQAETSAAPAPAAVASTPEPAAAPAQPEASSTAMPATPAIAPEVKTASPAPVIPAESKAETAPSAAPVAAPAAVAVTAPPQTAPPAVVATPAAPQAPVVDNRADVVDAIRRALDALPATSSKSQRASRAALTAYYQADTTVPLFTDGAGLTSRAKAAIEVIRQADDWGLRSRDFALPAGLPKDAAPAERADTEVKLGIAVLEYVHQARGGRMVPNDLSHAIDREPEMLAPDVALRELATTPFADVWLRQQHPRHVQFERLRRTYVALRDGKLPTIEPAASPEPQPSGKARKGQAASKPAAKPLSREQQLATLQRNMEMWRWMPRDLGRFHVIANIPEYTLRVVRNDSIEHEERIIVGKVANQTPAFSDKMETVVFHPFWGVPDSIKVKELLPALARGNNSLARSGLKLQHKGRDIDPTTINWAQTDIRNFHVYQPPGGGNVLGQVKFLFPNKHQVYMHDTPTKHLFASSQRTYSHGCMRVRNPMRFAEVLLGEDKGWSPGKVKSVLDTGPQNNNVKLDRKIPVHVAYFTATVGDDGKVRYLNDVYGHEKVVQMALDGKAHLIVKKKEDLGPIRAGAISQLSEGGFGSWWGGGGSGFSGGGGYSSGGGGGGGAAANAKWARDAFRAD